MILYTIGYEGWKVDDFLSALEAVGITKLIDLREVPISRKAGFSKSALAENACSFGMEYVHFSGLGCPRDIRHDYRRDKDWAKYSRRFLRFLAFQEMEIRKLANLVISNQSCLVCFEANFRYCHRYFVAESVMKIAGHDLTTKHLVRVQTKIVADPQPLAGISNR